MMKKILKEIKDMNTTKQLQLVTYEQAEKLKSLGFDWDVNYYWHIANKQLFPVTPAGNYNESESAISAPTVALALKWMREALLLVYSISIDIQAMKWKIMPHSKSWESYSTYEAAESALLDELLKNLDS